METPPPKGPKVLNQIGRDADESRMLVDLLCRRIVRPDFDRGLVPGRIGSPEDLVAVLGDGGDVLRRLLSEAERSEICQRVNSWQDRVETSAGSYEGSSLARILQATPRFPTLERVDALLGEEMAAMYGKALERIEADRGPYAGFPDERTNGGWSRQSAERAVSLVVDVIAPHGADPDAMAAAYARYMEEHRSQTREKKVTHGADREAKKAAAKSLGIWLPVPSDLRQWEDDPRTADRAAEFQRLTIRTVDKMRIMRSVLQFIPRRKFSNHTVADLSPNVRRMRAYVRDGENRDRVLAQTGGGGAAAPSQKIFKKTRE
jgi:hypothetical protein